MCPPTTESSRQIRLSLRRNASRTTTTVHYDWCLLNNGDIRDKYTLTLRNQSDEPQEISETLTLNDKYENFLNTQYMPTKQRAKSRVPWEALAVRKKRAGMKTASECYRRSSTNISALKLKKAQNELTNIYMKEPTESIQNQINKIRDY